MATYHLDREGFDEAILNAGFMLEAMRARAERAKAFAEGIAPVYADGPHPGRYKDSFHVDSGTHGGDDGRRAWATLSNDSPEALSVEFGTANNEAHHVLTRALDVIAGTQYARARGSNTPRGGSE